MADIVPFPADRSAFVLQSKPQSLTPEEKAFLDSHITELAWHFSHVPRDVTIAAVRRLLRERYGVKKYTHMPDTAMRDAVTHLKRLERRTLDHKQLVGTCRYWTDDKLERAFVKAGFDSMAFLAEVVR